MRQPGPVGPIGCRTAPCVRTVCTWAEAHLIIIFGHLTSKIVTLRWRTPGRLASFPENSKSKALSVTQFSERFVASSLKPIVTRPSCGVGLLRRSGCWLLDARALQDSCRRSAWRGVLHSVRRQDSCRRSVWHGVLHSVRRHQGCYPPRHRRRAVVPPACAALSRGYPRL